MKDFLNKELTSGDYIAVMQEYDVPLLCEVIRESSNNTIWVRRLALKYNNQPKILVPESITIKIPDSDIMEYFLENGNLELNNA